MCRANGALVKTITTYVNLAASGQFPQWYYDIMAEARLIALAKKEETEEGAKGSSADLLKDLRPIAMGNIFEAYQFGAGAKLGAETLHHIVKNAIKDNPDWKRVSNKEKLEVQ
eukprot:gene27993-34784_t